MTSRRILFVTTSHATFDNSDRPTGLWWEEFTTPLEIFRSFGHSIDVASPKGGLPPIDPASLDGSTSSAAATDAMTLLRDTIPLDDIEAADYSAIFLVGGHGTMWDFPGNPALNSAVSTVAAAGVVGAVCHGVAGIIRATSVDAPLVERREITAFSDAEEVAAGADQLIPFSLEQKLRELGAKVNVGAPFMAHLTQDGRLVTGQNPQSSRDVALATAQLVGSR